MLHIIIKINILKRITILMGKINYQKGIPY